MSKMALPNLFKRVFTFIPSFPLFFGVTYFIFHLKSVSCIGSKGSESLRMRPLLTERAFSSLLLAASGEREAFEVCPPFSLCLGSFFVSVRRRGLRGTWLPKNTFHPVPSFELETPPPCTGG